MASNYSLVINSKFKPFSFDEMLKPVMIAEQAHKEIEDAYADLATKSNVWDKLTNETTDPRAHKMYQSFADDLATQADELAKYGVQTTSRATMKGLNARYARDITPIENAYKKREAQAAAQQQALMQNPTLFFSRNAATTSLDDYIDNPNLDYTPFSGSQLTAMVSTAATNLAKELTETEEGRSKLKQILPYQYEYIKKRGFSSKDVALAIARDSNASNILTGLVDQTLEASGMQNWSNWNQLKDQAYYYANLGLYNAIGQDEVSILKDDLGMQMAMEREKQRLAAEQAAKQSRIDAGDIPLFFDELTSPNLEAEGEDRNKEKIRIENGERLLSSINGTRSTVKVTTGYERVRGQGAITSYANSVGAGAADLVAKQIDVTVAWTDKRGRIYNRQDFVNHNIKHIQGYNNKSSKERNQIRQSLHHIYNTMGNITAMAGASGDTTAAENMPTIAQVQQSLRTTRQNFDAGKAPYTINALEFRFGKANSDNNKVFQDMLLPKLQFGDKTYLHEVSSISRDGAVNTKPGYIDADEFVDSDNKLKGSPQFYRINTPEGQHGIIIKMNGKQYWAPENYLGNIFGESNIDVNTLRDLYNTRQDLISQYGEEAYNLSEEGYQLNQAINNMGASSVRRAAAGLAGSYNTPTFSLTSEN